MIVKITSLENDLYRIGDNDIPMELTGMVEFAKTMLPNPKDFDEFMEKLKTKKYAELELTADTGLVVDMFEVDYPEGGQGTNEEVLQNLDRKKDLVSETVLPNTTVPDVNMVVKPPRQSALDMDKYTSDGRPIHPKTICRKCGNTTQFEYEDECFSCQQKSSKKDWRDTLRSLGAIEVIPAPTKAPERSPERMPVTIPEKMPPPKPSRPSPFRKPNIEPGKEPQPKALPVSYPTEGKARMHPKLQKMINNKDTPYHSLPSIPGGEFLADIASKIFQTIVKAIEKYSGIQVRTVNDVAPALMQILQRVKQIEGSHTQQLENLAVQLVEQYFGIKHGEMEFDAKLQRNVELSGIKNLDSEQAKEVGEELPSFDIDLEVSKRRFINGLIQGAGINSLYMFHLIEEDLNSIDPDLTEMYGLLAALTEFGYWVTPPTMSGLELSAAPAGGQVQLDFSKEEPIVIAVALTFPMLIHELVKGVMELMSSHGLPEDDETRERVLRTADNFQDETWDIRFGPEIWKRLVNALTTQNLNSRALSMLYDEMVQMDAATFSDFMHGVLSNDPRMLKKWNDMYNKTVEELGNEHTSALENEDYNSYHKRLLAKDETPITYIEWLREQGLSYE